MSYEGGGIVKEKVMTYRTDGHAICDGVPYAHVAAWLWLCYLFSYSVYERVGDNQQRLTKKYFGIWNERIYFYWHHRRTKTDGELPLVS